MSAEQLVTYLTWIVYLLILFLVARQAIRHPRRTNIDIALFFLVPGGIIGIGIAAAILSVGANPLLNAINGTLALSLAYLLVRLVDDFAKVPVVVKWTAAVGWVSLSAGLFIWAP
ncbi:MAG: hypothetical protein ACRDIB_18465, partial [Ardenticatenaceae bacterium]